MPLHSHRNVCFKQRGKEGNSGPDWAGLSPVESTQRIAKIDTSGMVKEKLQHELCKCVLC